MLRMRERLAQILYVAEIGLTITEYHGGDRAAGQQLKMEPTLDSISVASHRYRVTIGWMLSKRSSAKGTLGSEGSVQREASSSRDEGSCGGELSEGRSAKGTLGCEQRERSNSLHAGDEVMRGEKRTRRKALLGRVGVRRGERNVVRPGNKHLECGGMLTGFRSARSYRVESATARSTDPSTARRCRKVEPSRVLSSLPAVMRGEKPTQRRTLLGRTCVRWCEHRVLRSGNEHLECGGILTRFGPTTATDICAPSRARSWELPAGLRATPAVGNCNRSGPRDARDSGDECVERGCKGSGHRNLQRVTRNALRAQVRFAVRSISGWRPAIGSCALARIGAPPSFPRTVQTPNSFSKINERRCLTPASIAHSLNRKHRLFFSMRRYGLNRSLRPGERRLPARTAQEAACALPIKSRASVSTGTPAFRRAGIHGAQSGWRTSQAQAFRDAPRSSMRLYELDRRLLPGKRQMRPRPARRAACMLPVKSRASALTRMPPPFRRPQPYGVQNECGTARELPFSHERKILKGDARHARSSSARQGARIALSKRVVFGAPRDEPQSYCGMQVAGTRTSTSLFVCGLRTAAAHGDCFARVNTRIHMRLGRLRADGVGGTMRTIR